MKKSLLLVAIAINTGTILAQSQRLVFVEEFTQASCGPCAAANPAFNTLLSANSSKAVSVKYQVSWPGTDPMNAQNPTEVASRVAYYGVSGVPDARMDGNVVAGAPGDITQTKIDNQYAVASPFSINLKHWFNTANDSIFINCEIEATQNTTFTKGKLHVVMVEKTITFTNAPGTNGEKDFYNVFRKAYPTVAGTDLVTSWTSGQKKTVSFKAKIPAYVYDKSQIAIVAWIQENADKNVKQAAFSSVASTPLALAPVADFSADVVSTCDGNVVFTDQSVLFPSQWLWDFGDGSTSSSQNPTHHYSQNGTYTVKLTAANKNGNNQAIKTSYVTVATAGTAPAGVNDNICGVGVAHLSATPVSGGTIYWYNSIGQQVGTGNSISPTCTGTTNYYASEAIPNATITIGAASNSIGAGGNFTANDGHGIYFDVSKPCILRSVDVYAGAAGNRTFEVIDINGQAINSAVKNLTAGKNTVTLDFSLPVGSGYLIKIKGTLVDLYRNSAGGMFPYTTAVITLTGHTASGSPAYYYYFYNWQVQQNPCMSLSTPVSAFDTCTTNIPVNAIEASINIFPNPGNGEFSLSFSTSRKDNYMVKILNSIGQVVYSEGLNSFVGNYTRKMNVALYGKGVYVVHISGSNGETVKKLTVY